MKRLRATLGGLLALGMASCAPQTSLDAVSTTSAEGGPTSGSSDAPDSSSGPGDDEPMAVICEETCTPLLRPIWSYEGPEGTRVVVEMERDADGSFVLGLQRLDGGLGLLRLSPEGEPSWSAVPGLPCDDCLLEDIALHPSGDIILSATSPTEPLPAPPSKDGPPLPPEDLILGQALLARFDVTQNRLAWTHSLALRRGVDTWPRAGEVTVLDDDRIIQAIVSGTIEGEEIDIQDYRGDGTLRRRRYVTDQVGSGPGRSPLVARGSTGDLIIAHPWWDPELEQMYAASWRMVPPSYHVFSQLTLMTRLDDLAVDSAGRRVELAHSRGEQSVTLLLTSRASSDPERWSTSLPIVTTSETRPALAIGPDDSVYTAARATPRLRPDDPYVVMLEIARWSSSGELRWQSQRPLNMMATDDPLELLVDDDHSLIVGTVVDGQVNVVRYEQACTCP